MMLKNFIRASLNFFHLDLTKNLEYDRLTKSIMKQVIKRNSNCIDIGCHKGEILELMIRYSPEGKHFAFEPIPFFYENLKFRFGLKASVFHFALSDKNGFSSFQFVKNAPAFSGLKKRKYETENPEIEEINVETKKLDDVVGEQKIDFIKIDVEGAEFSVLKGAKNVLMHSKPIIIFEFGLGASDFYGTKPDDIFNFLTTEINLKISLLKNYLKNQKPLNVKEFHECYNNNKEYYFIAHP